MKPVLKRSVFLALFYCASLALNATTYHVSTTGNDATGNGSASSPWKTLKRAFQRNTSGGYITPFVSGDIVQVSAGIFIEDAIIYVPTGVSIWGSTTGITTVETAASLHYFPSNPAFGLASHAESDPVDRFLFVLRSPSRTNTDNQSLKNLTIRGSGKRLHGGIYIKSRNNVVIDHIQIQETNFCGIWLWDVKETDLVNISTQNCAWGSATWSSGAIQLTQSEDIEISQVTMVEGPISGRPESPVYWGYGIKALPNDINTLKNILLHNFNISVDPRGAWQNGGAPNISVEFFAGSLKNVQIYDGVVDNHMSIVSHATPAADESVKIYRNRFNTQGKGYNLELSYNNVEIYENWFNGGDYGIVHWNADRKCTNWNVHHNTFYLSRPLGANPASMIMTHKNGIEDVSITNNTVEMTGEQTDFIVFDNAADVKVNPTSRNINISRNLIIDSQTSHTRFENRVVRVVTNGLQLVNVNVSNNWFQDITGDAITGVTYSNNQSGNPLITKTNPRPDPYYRLQPNFPAGMQGIGAYEPAPSISVTSVSVSPNAASLAVGSAQQLTKAISPANATNQNVTWSTSNPGVAAVNSNGLVTALAAGTATITVTTADGNRTATSTITVNANASVTIVDNAVTGTGPNQHNYAGSWAHAATVPTFLQSTLSYSNTVNNTMTFVFTGNKIDWFTEKKHTHGIAAVSIDNGPEVNVDLYSATEQQQVLVYSSATLTQGNHTFKIRVTGTKNPASTETYAIHDYVRIHSAVAVTGVTVLPATASLTLGGTNTLQLTETVSPSSATNKNVTWTTSNASVATVSTTGLVTAQAPGNATITVTTADGNRTATSTVTVIAPVTGVAVTPTSATLSVGGTQQLTKTITPANATNQNVTWSSNNTSVASVNSNGLVTALASGTATITVTTADGNRTASSTITVNPNASVVTVDNAERGTGTNQHNYVGSAWVHPANVPTFLNSTLSYSNATDNYVTFAFTGNRIEWYTEKKHTHGIAAVSIDGGPEVNIDLYSATELPQVNVYTSTGLTQGNHTFKIRVTGMKHASSTGSYIVHDFVKVFSGNVAVTGVTLSPATATLTMGGTTTAQLTATVNPSTATNKNVAWTSSNTNIATVNSSGLVTAVAAGSATITVTTQEGNFTASSAITVNPSTPSGSASYYVGGAGASDSNPGTASQPFATIQKAASLAIAGDVIKIRSGTYRETIVPANSGAGGNPIVYEPDQGAIVIVSGLNEINNTGWTVHSGNIYKKTVTLAVNGYNQTISGNTVILANQIFKNGAMQFEARWPKIDSPDDLFNRDVVYRGRTSTSTWTNTSLTDGGLPNIQGGWVGAKLCITGWFITHTTTVTSHAGTTIGFNSPQGDLRFHQYYYLTGKLGALTQAKEWHYESNTLYFWQEGGGPPSGLEYKARNWGFDLKEKSNITVKGLQFIACEPMVGNTNSANIILDGIKSKHQNHTVLQEGEDVIYYNAKQTGIKLIGAGSVIRNSELQYTASQALWLGENCRAENNLITDVNYEANYGAGIGLWDNSGNQVITRNTIARAGRSAIDFGSYIKLGRHLSVDISYNDVYHFGMLHADVGGMYGARSTNLTGSRIHHNWIHDNLAKITPVASFEVGINAGIYFDQATGPATVDHNVFWNNYQADYVIENANDDRFSGPNFVYNNTFASRDQPPHGYRRSYFTQTNGPDTTDVQRNNIYRDLLFFRWHTSPSAGNVQNFILETTDPKFLASGNGGLFYRLSANSSEAIDKGIAIPGITNGSIGAPDIGAYEFGGENWVAGYNTQSGSGPGGPPEQPDNDALIALHFNTNSGTTPVNTGTAVSTFTRTSPTPAWSTNTPATVGGASSVDFAVTNGNNVVESDGVIEGLKNLSAFTLTGWVNCKSNVTGSGGNRIISWINNGGDGVDLVYNNNGSLQLGIDQWPDGSPAVSSINKVTTNVSAPATNWVFFAVSYQSSANQVLFYFGNNATDASLDASRTYNRGPVGSNIARLAIGHFNSMTRSGALDRMFKGLIDEIYIHGSALTLPEIIAIQRGTGTSASSGARLAKSDETSNLEQMQEDGGNDFHAYPNPLKSGEIIYLELPDNTGELKITDIVGNPCHILQVTNKKLEIPTNGLSEGIYFLRYRSAKTVISFKLMIN